MPKAQSIKEKADKLNRIKIKNFCSVKAQSFCKPVTALKKDTFKRE